MIESSKSAESREGIASYLEKRKPNFDDPRFSGSKPASL